MIELERHIEVLLLDNDCVIVPGLGGFVAHYVGARYDGNDEMFLPPLRSIGFNPKLNVNDSLLAQSYVEAYDISYPEAMSWIERDVNELVKTLGRDRHYDISGIGALSLNDNGIYEFQPCEAGLLTPDLYGLYSFGIESVNDVADKASGSIGIVEEENTGIKHSDESKDTIKIRLSWVRNIAAAAIAIFAFFIISPPIGSHGDEIAGINLEESFLFKLMPKEVTIPVKVVNTPAKEILQKEPVASIAATENVVVEDVQEQQLPQQPQVYYSIVLASKVAERNANDYVERLHKKGFSDAFVYKSKTNVVRVLCGRYETESAAYAALNSKHADDTFSQGWVYKVVE